jgi:hypothetical protein
MSEGSSTAEPNARDVMLPSELILSVDANTTVEEAASAAKPGQTLLVREEDLPLGICPEEMLLTFRERDAPLQEYSRSLALPTLTTADTPLSLILLNMQTWPEIRWHVVQNGNQFEGLIPPLVGTIASSVAEVLQDRVSSFGIRGPFSTLAGPVVATFSQPSRLSTTRLRTEPIDRFQFEMRRRSHDNYLYRFQVAPFRGSAAGHSSSTEMLTASGQASTLGGGVFVPGAILFGVPVEGLHGDPHTKGSNVCYCCKGEPRHCFPRTQAVEQDSWPVVMCPECRKRAVPRSPCPQHG